MPRLTSVAYQRHGKASLAQCGILAEAQFARFRQQRQQVVRGVRAGIEMQTILRAEPVQAVAVQPAFQGAVAAPVDADMRFHTGACNRLG